jgi:hypothetical protein
MVQGYFSYSIPWCNLSLDSWDVYDLYPPDLQGEW